MANSLAHIKGDRNPSAQIRLVDEERLVVISCEHGRRGETRILRHVLLKGKEGRLNGNTYCNLFLIMLQSL